MWCGVALPPHEIADLGVGRDRVAARDQGIGEPDEPGLLSVIARGCIRTAGRDLVKADMVRLPVGQRELETLPAAAFDGLWRRRPPVDDDPAYATMGRASFRRIVRVDRFERQDGHSRSR